MTTEQILKAITSWHAHDAWKASSEIVRHWQDRDAILPLIPRLSEIESGIKHLKEEGLSALDERFMNFALKTLQFYRDGQGCRCNLYTALETFNPNDENEKGNVEILNTVRDCDRCVDYYVVRCCNCGEVYKAVERHYNYTLWGWIKNVADPWNFDYYLDFPSPDKSHRLVYERLCEVGMGAPLRGDGYLVTEDKRKIKIHDSCGGPPVWHTSGKMVAVPIWTYENGQRMGVVDVTEMNLRIFREPMQLLHIRSFDKTVIELSYKKFDIAKKPIEWLMKL